MRQAFRTSRLMGLFALVVGLMAFGATAAQAEPGAVWKVAGANVTDALNVELGATLENNHGILVSKSGANKVEILCKKIKFVSALLKVLGAALGKIHFDECITVINLVTVPTCVPKSPGAASGLIETEFLKGLLKLHTLAGGAKDDLLELAPEVGTEFVKLQLGSGMCPIGQNFPITGVFFMKDCLNQGLVEQVTHLAEEGPLTALFFGGNPATIKGSANVSLTGAHAGLKWSGIVA